MLSVPAISVVDDDEASRLAIASLVRSLGWKANVFESAEQYLHLLSSAPADHTACLISDIKMPGMSGIELHERLLASGRAPPTIFVTAFATDPLRAQVMANGALALLEKPIDAGALAHYLTVAAGTP
ncbi:MAG TPA: response regulator [Trinickia sp.]|uniref:response regulator transcription factor n=1 Tax=Trinickia sp. TaxID=2571163 RepID=UPI002C0B6E63|nr:response regulator [Trinickia sp.]HTI19138.1 response regulator [Trinickia sp.]